ncbi:hypothetical protein [Cryobacterium sp. Y57]|uniref:hypothetical protein n=1 Tax=Cryobacterium sp. Y57 TaxID=2048287 RepID=UPI000CE54E76|nr:hypothetical protein [Cryobacterium sp. Y57]
MAWKLIYAGTPVGPAIDDAEKATMIKRIDTIINSEISGWLKASIAPGQQPYLELLVTAGIPIAFAYEAENDKQIPSRLQ